MRVRPFRDSDDVDVAKIFFTAVHQIASAHYSVEQILAWAPAIPSTDRYQERAGDGRTMLVAVDDHDIPIAYGDLEPDGHIDHLYCRPDHSRTGVAAVLYRELERTARSAGISRLYVEASEPARRFFERQGFEVEARNEFDLNGVAIHNWRMAKKL